MIQSLFLAMITLILGEVVQCKLLKLSPIKCSGTFCLPSGNKVPAVYLSKPKLEILQDEKDDRYITLCDVVPILIPDDPLNLSNSMAKPGSLNKLSTLTTRDNGIYDNLPYDWGTERFAKKAVFDFMNEAKNRGVNLIEHFSLFEKAMKDILDVSLTGLLVEVEDSYADNRVALGGALVLARPDYVDAYTLRASNPILPKERATEMREACVVNCHLDELVGFALATELPIYIKNSLYDIVSTDASLVNNAKRGDRSDADEEEDEEEDAWDSTPTTPTIYSPVLTDLRPRSKRNSGTGKNKKATKQPVKNDEEEYEYPPAWEIYSPQQFLAFSNNEKREVLRASGMRSLPRPREGSAKLDALLFDLMDDAVRGEVMRLQYLAAASAANTGQTPAAADSSSRSSSGAGESGEDAAKRKAKKLKRQYDDFMNGLDASSTFATTDNSAAAGAGFGAGAASVASEASSASAGESGSTGGNSRQELLQGIGEALEEGNVELAEQLRAAFAAETNLRADPTQPKGSYDMYLDQDDWYQEQRRRAMAPKKSTATTTTTSNDQSKQDREQEQEQYKKDKTAE